jgi:predicted nucleic acid-binding protein
MNDKRFVDTNILIYAHDHSCGTKHEQARALVSQFWEAGNAVISTQVLQELYICLRRKVATPLSAAEVEQILRDYFAWEVVLNTRQSILDAITIETRHRVSFWDGLILQAAKRAGARIVYSEDLSHGQMYDRITVINPFLA